MSAHEQLEGRNPVIEALRRKRRPVRKIFLDERAKENPKIRELLQLAREQGISVQRVPRQTLDRRSRAGVHNGVMALADPLPELSVHQRLEEVLVSGEYPFFVLIDEVQYEHNLGAILRSALGAGVHAVVIPVRRGKGVTPVVHRVSMGGAESVPVIREGISSALATLKRAGIPIVGADMDGKPCWSVPMKGAVAVVLGGEDKGLTNTLRKRCDHIVSVPLAGDLDSLNVSVTAGILLFEKCRQDSLTGGAGT